MVQDLAALPRGMPAQCDMSSTVVLNSIESTAEVSMDCFFCQHEEDVRNPGFHVLEGQRHEQTLLLVDPVHKKLQKLHGDLGVPHHERLEVVTGELQRLHLVQGDCRGRSRSLLQDGHFPEDLTGLKDGNVLFKLSHYLDDLDAPGLKEVEGVPGLVLAENDVTLSESDHESVEYRKIKTDSAAHAPPPSSALNAFFTLRMTGSSSVPIVRIFLNKPPALALSPFSS